MEPVHAQAALRRMLDDLLSANDQPGAVLAALKAVADGEIGIADLYVNVLGPLMTETGGRWREGRTRVWQEHLASATVRMIVDALFPVVHEQAGRVTRRGLAVLACPPEEQHDLGLRMLADRMALAGWHPRFLGADTPIVEIAEAASALDAELVVLSASTHFGRVRLAEYVARLRELLPETRLAVGGVAFERDREGWPPEAFLTEADLRPLGPVGDNGES